MRSAEMLKLGTATLTVAAAAIEGITKQANNSRRSMSATIIIFLANVYFVLVKK